MILKKKYKVDDNLILKVVGKNHEICTSDCFSLDLVDSVDGEAGATGTTGTTGTAGGGDGSRGPEIENSNWEIWWFDDLRWQSAL